MDPSIYKLFEKVITHISSVRPCTNPPAPENSSIPSPRTRRASASSAKFEVESLFLLSRSNVVGWSQVTRAIRIILAMTRRV